MDRNQTPNINRNQQQSSENSDGPGWGTIFGGIGLALGAAAAAGAVLISRHSEESSSSSSSRVTRTTSSSDQPNQIRTEFQSTSFHSRTVHNPMPSSPEKPEGNCLILAVDASPVRGGAILRMCSASRKLIYFYSVDWSRYLNFPHESDKFEMVNALLALLSLKQQINSLKTECWQELVLKTDNNFINTTRYVDPEDDRLLRRFKAEISELNVTLEHARQRYDFDMKNSNQLSKGGASEWVRHNLQEDYNEYTVIDMSDEAESYLGRNLNMVPTRYHVSR